MHKDDALLAAGVAAPAARPNGGGGAVAPPPAQEEEVHLAEREVEVALLQEVLQGARRGEGSVVVVRGAFGLGKTSVVELAEGFARDAGMEVLSAYGREFERDFDYGVARQLFELRIARAPEGERQRVLAGHARLAGAALASTEPPPAAQEASLLHGLYWLCRNLAESRPLLLTVDDAELSDASTLRLMLYLAQRIQGLPAAVVLSAAGGGRLDAGKLLDEIVHHPATRVADLHPLSDSAATRYLQKGFFPDAASAFCGAVYEATLGNPLLLGELATELAGGDAASASQEDVARVADAAPESVALALRAHVNRLGPQARELLDAVAMLGDDVEPRHAAALVELDQSEVVRVAERLVRLGVFARSERLRFAQPVVARALYAAQPPTRRAEAHRSAARMLANEGAGPELVAERLLNASRSGECWAVDALTSAAAGALAGGRPERAVCYLRRALDEPPQADKRTGILLSLGRAEALTGEPAAVSRLAHAMDVLDEPRDRAVTALEMGRTLYARGMHEQAADAFRRGIEEVGEADEKLLAQLRAAQAGAVGGNGRSTEEPRRPTALSCDGPLPLDATTRAEPGARIVLAERAMEAAMQGKPCEEMRGLAVRALDRGQLLDDETADGRAYYLAAGSLVAAEDLATAEAALTAAVEDARRRGSVFGFATASYFRSWAIYRRGRVDDAAADAENALVARRQGWRLALSGAHAVLAAAMIERDDLEAAQRELDRAAVHLQVSGDLSLFFFLATRAHLRLLRRDSEQARDEFLECGRRLAEADAHGQAWIAWRLGAAAASAQLGNFVEARRLAAEELEVASRVGVPGATGRALTTLGSLTGGADGLVLLGQAVDLLESAQTALFRAQAYVEQGIALRRAGQRRDSRQPLRRGLDLAERLGARRLARLARSELLAAGARPRRAALTGQEALTPREHHVAGLAAQGLTNREIAEALFVTVKTIEWHLKNSYEKLEVRSRRELRDVLSGRSRSPSG